MRATNSKHQCGLPILPESPRVSRFVAQTVASPEKKCRLTVARRRRLFTVFPCAEFRVIVNGVANLFARAAFRSGNATALHFQRIFRRSEAHRSSPESKNLMSCRPESLAAGRSPAFPLLAVPQKPAAIIRARTLPPASPCANTFRCASTQFGPKIPPPDSIRASPLPPGNAAHPPAYAAAAAIPLSRQCLNAASVHPIAAKTAAAPAPALESLAAFRRPKVDPSSDLAARPCRPAPTHSPPANNLRPIQNAAASRTDTAPAARIPTPAKETVIHSPAPPARSVAPAHAVTDRSPLPHPLPRVPPEASTIPPGISVESISRSRSAPGSQSARALSLPGSPAPT